MASSHFDRLIWGYRLIGGPCCSVLMFFCMTGVLLIPFPTHICFPIYGLIPSVLSPCREFGAKRVMTRYLRDDVLGLPRSFRCQLGPWETRYVRNDILVFAKIVRFILTWTMGLID